MTALLCKVCKSSEKKEYKYLPSTNDYICAECFGTPDKPTVAKQPKQHLPIFTQWQCKRHNCGSYNINNLGRHEMHTCEIVFVETVGVVRPKTYGGYNGDVGRVWFKDHDNFVNRKSIRKKKVNAWEQYQKTHVKVSPGRQRKNNYWKRKNWRPNMYNVRINAHTPQGLQQPRS